MILTLPRKASIGAVAAAAALTAASFGAAVAPSPAAANTPFYTAELAEPVEGGVVIAGGVAWNCKGNKCVAGKGSSRPLRVCRELQREHGQIAGFTTKGEALAEDKLAKCNG